MNVRDNNDIELTQSNLNEYNIPDNHWKVVEEFDNDYNIIIADELYTLLESYIPELSEKFKYVGKIRMLSFKKDLTNIYYLQEWGGLPQIISITPYTFMNNIDLNLTDIDNNILTIMIRMIIYWYTKKRAIVVRSHVIGETLTNRIKYSFSNLILYLMTTSHGTGPVYMIPDLINQGKNIMMYDEVLEFPIRDEASLKKFNEGLNKQHELRIKKLTTHQSILSEMKSFLIGIGPWIIILGILIGFGYVLWNYPMGTFSICLWLIYQFHKHIIRLV